MGRKLTPLDEEAVLKLARLGCTNGEIGAFFGVSDETIRVRFLDLLALGRADQKISLRRCQWKSARGGNVPMQIHLGKQYLGQSDKQELTGPGGSTLFPQSAQQRAVADRRVAELQCEIDELIGTAAPVDPGRLRDEGEPGPVGDGPPPVAPEPEAD